MILERKKIAGQNSKAKATVLNQKDRIQELVGSPSLNKQSGARAAGYYSNHRLSRDRSKACAVQLQSFVPRLGIPPTPTPERPVASCSLSLLLGVTSCRGQAVRGNLRRRRSAGARGAGTRVLSDRGVAARNPSVTWSPQGASAKGGHAPVVRVPACGHPGHRGAGRGRAGAGGKGAASASAATQLLVSLRPFPTDLTVHRRGRSFV